MGEKRFIVETVEITDVDTDESRISEVITDMVETYSYETFEDVCDLLNSQIETIAHLDVRIYCQDQEIQKLQNQLNQIPPNIKEVWLE